MGRPPAPTFRTETFPIKTFRTKAFPIKTFRTKTFPIKTFRTKTFPIKTFRTKTFRTEISQAETFELHGASLRILGDGLKSKPQRYSLVAPPPLSHSHPFTFTPPSADLTPTPTEERV